MSPPVGPVPDGRDPDEYDRLRRKVLWLLPTGLYVLGTCAGTRRNLMTISWVTQVALEPKLVGVGVERKAVTHELLEEGGVFALSILPRHERALIRKFVKPVQDQRVDERGAGTMQGVRVRAESTGAPVLEPAIAWIDCRVRHCLPLGSHSWLVGEVVDCGSTALESAAGPGDTGSQSPGDTGSQSPDGGGPEVLRMEDTRMSYGG